MEQKKLKWKDVYNNNIKRRYCEITGIKEKDIEIESNSFTVLKKRKYIVLIVAIITTILLILTFKDNIKIMLILLAFFAGVGICFFIFNYFKFKCEEDGLYIRFGFQKGKFSYDKLKSVYLSKYNDYSFLIPTKRIYSIVLRYVDNTGRIKELSFCNYFITPEDTEKFLSNFEIKEAEENRYVGFERFKAFRKIGKILIFVLFVAIIIGYYFIKR